eukprot:136186-Amphidinium_carterae.1
MFFPRQWKTPCSRTEFGTDSFATSLSNNSLPLLFAWADQAGCSRRSGWAPRIPSPRHSSARVPVPHRTAPEDLRRKWFRYVGD